MKKQPINPTIAKHNISQEAIVESRSAPSYCGGPLSSGLYQANIKLQTESSTVSEFISMHNKLCMNSNEKSIAVSLVLQNMHIICMTFHKQQIKSTHVSSTQCKKLQSSKQVVDDEIENLI